MILRIRNMESNRCITAVKNELGKLGVNYNFVEMGEIELKGNISQKEMQMIDLALKNIGLELMGNKNALIIEMIKAAIHELVYSSDDLPKQNFSEYISQAINRDYASLSILFSRELTTTIEKYIIVQKIERVKELLVYDQLSLNDIAFKLQYNSVAHLSSQFKKVTGLTPSFYKQLRKSKKLKP